MSIVCGRCGKIVQKDDVLSQKFEDKCYCPHCNKAIAIADLKLNHFELFNVAVQYDISVDDLLRKKLQKILEIHPDVTQSTYDLAVAEENTMMYNSAFSILSDESARMRYIFTILGYVDGRHRDFQESVEYKTFLFEMMELQDKKDAADGCSKKMGLCKSECQKLHDNLLDEVINLLNDKNYDEGYMCYIKLRSIKAFLQNF